MTLKTLNTHKLKFIYGVGMSPERVEAHKHINKSLIYSNIIEIKKLKCEKACHRKYLSTISLPLVKYLCNLIILFFDVLMGFDECINTTKFPCDFRLQNITWVSYLPEFPD